MKLKKERQKWKFIYFILPDRNWQRKLDSRACAFNPPTALEEADTRRKCLAKSKFNPSSRIHPCRLGFAVPAHPFERTAINPVFYTPVVPWGILFGQISHNSMGIN